MESNINKTSVVLFQSEISENDNKYIKLLNESGISARSIPTLSFNFINQEKLYDCLKNANDFSGIIFTSTRAVDAVASVFTSKSLSMESWKEKFNFSIGKATSDLASSLLNLETFGSDSGNSENLCQFIITKCKQYSKPFIYPCSSIRKNTILDTLSKHDIQVKELVCYETSFNSLFKDLWANLILNKNLPEILVFFSPSGVQFCNSIIKESYSNMFKPKIIAIGPNTEKAIFEANMNPCVVAEKPNPASVLSAVQNLLLI